MTKKTEFRIEQLVLGKGSFSVVKLALGPSQNLAAAKLVDLWKNKDVFEREVSALARLSHPNIVQCLHTQTFADGQGCIFLEYIPHPTLLSQISQTGPLSTTLALHLFFQLVDAVDHMHKNNVAHLDLKSENLSVDLTNKTVKVFDFGLSQTVTPQSPLSDNFVGSPMYMAPEVLMREKYNPFSADIWSLGIVLFEMMTGRTPFSTFVSMDELLDFVCFETSVPLPSDSIPPEVRVLLQKMLDFSPLSRITISSVRNFINQQLNHLLVTECSAVQCS